MTSDRVKAAPEIGWARLDLSKDVRWTKKCCEVLYEHMKIFFVQTCGVFTCIEAITVATIASGSERWDRNEH